MSNIVGTIIPDASDRQSKPLEVISIIVENTSTEKTAKVILLGGSAISEQNIKSLLKHGEFTTAEGVTVKASPIAEEVDLNAVVSYCKAINPIIGDIAVTVLSKENQIEQGQSSFIVGKQNRVGQIENQEFAPAYDNDKKKFSAKFNRGVFQDNTLTYPILPGMKVQLDIQFLD